MKVLKLGEEGGYWKKEETCTGKGNKDDGCGAVLEVHANDIFLTCTSDYTGDKDYYMTFECPVCNAWTDMNSSDIPSGLRSKVMSQTPRNPRKR